VKYRCLNMLIGAVGGSQPVLPKRNFARFILMMFLLYALVIRTLYQGSYFKLLKSNRPKRKVQSIDEMVEKDFKFYVSNEVAELFQATAAVEERYTDKKLMFKFYFQ